ncbi:hypothetical protein D3C76_1245700 [compost metagenome]
MRADAAGINVDLNDFGITWVECTIGELGAEQHQGVGVHHGVEPGRETNQAGHPDIVRVIVFHMLFTAQGVNNRRFNFSGKFH